LEVGVNVIMSKTSKCVVPYINVRFCIGYKVESEKHVLAVLGQDKNLGEWDTQKAAVARNVGDGQWVVEVALPSKQAVYFVWAILDRETMELVKLEKHGHRTFTTPTDLYKMTMTCVFGGGQMGERELIVARKDSTSSCDHVSEDISFSR
jgi:hypothetical protein